MRSFDVKVAYADLLEVRTIKDAKTLGACAAAQARAIIAEAVGRQGFARIVIATGASQFPFFDAVVNEDVDWSKVDVFHLDEYAGMDDKHPASFRRYLRERFVEKAKPRSFHGVMGDAPDLDAECKRYGALLDEGPIDLCVAGIGENGHLAFNDPPVADFNDPVRVKVVELDEACRKQQFGEGWFASMDEVPKRALTQTITSVLSAKRLILVVPEQRKAEAVKNTINGPVSTACPASILRTQPHAVLYLDKDSASQLDLK